MEIKNQNDPTPKLTPKMTPKIDPKNEFKMTPN